MLREIDAGEVPELLVCQQDRRRRRRDRSTTLLARASRCRSRCRPRTGEGIDELLDAIGERLRALARIVELRRAVRPRRRARRAAPRRRGARRGARRRAARACGPASPTGSSPGSSAFIVTDTESTDQMTRRDGGIAGLRAAAVPARPARRVPATRRAPSPAASSTARSAPRRPDARDRGARARGDALAARPATPPTIGSAAYRAAAAAWIARRFGVRARRPIRSWRASARRSSSRRCRALLSLARPDARHRAVSRRRRTPPTRWGRRSRAAGRAGAARRATGISISARVATPTPSARCCCGSTTRPTRPASAADRAEMQAAVEWAREPGHDRRERRVLRGVHVRRRRRTGAAGHRADAGVDGVLAVHSLSKRSNMAGLRAGFVAGDADLVRYLGEIRKHGGLMTPDAGPGRGGGRARRRRRTSTSSEPGTRERRSASRSRARSLRDSCTTAVRRPSTCGCAPPTAPTTAGRSPARLADDGPARGAGRSLRRPAAPTTCASRSASPTTGST